MNLRNPQKILHSLSPEPQRPPQKKAAPESRAPLKVDSGAVLFQGKRQRSGLHEIFG